MQLLIDPGGIVLTKQGESHRSGARVDPGTDRGVGSEGGAVVGGERWLTTPIEAPANSAESAEREPAPRPALRPTAPQGGVPAPAEGLPIRRQTRSAPLWWVGAHGGAGESTLAAAVEGSAGGGHAWPATAGGSPRVVLVARTHASGLRAAQLAATQWASGSVPEVELLGLVLVADAPGRLPRELRDLTRLVAGGVPHVWNVPWLEQVRRGEPAAAWPRSTRAMFSELLSGSSVVRNEKQEGTR